ncbi:MAG: metal ABC transporter permease [Clostridia bacterium]|nr:metal ABC transporter permease [Clostridia bacterium]
MLEMLQQIGHILSYPFAVRALIVGILVALCASLLGVSLVLKRMSFIGDGLSHVAFGALAIATALKLSDEMLLVLPITVIAAVLLLRSGKKAKIRGDASLALWAVGSLALGYLIINLFGNGGNVAGDVCTTLFGSTSILTLKTADLWICGIMAAVVLLLFFLFYRQIFAITFDEEFAAATGLHTQAYQLLIAAITAVVIVIAMNLVGSLLISALVIFPALAAMQVFKRFRDVMLCSALVGVGAAALGILISFAPTQAPIPMGATVVAVNLAIFLIFALIGKFKSLQIRKNHI